MLTQNELKKWLEYDQETGLFQWTPYALSTRGPRRKIGWFPGTLIRRGYLQISVNKKKYFAHTLAYLYVWGDFTIGLDHINNNPSDNRVINLRIANQSQNMMNTKMYSNNTSGDKGIYFNNSKNKWTAQISKDRVKKIKSFKTREEAAEWRNRMEEELFGQFSNSESSRLLSLYKT